MHYDLEAARRLLSIGTVTERAGSVLNEFRPVYHLPGDVDLGGLNFDIPAENEFPGITPALLAELVAAQAAKVALLTVQVEHEFLPLATAWPISSGDNADTPGLTHRFVTAGHVLEVILTDQTPLLTAAEVQTRQIRPAQIVFPNGTIRNVVQWVCSSELDVAVFDVDGPDCPGFWLDGDSGVSENVAVMGYPLFENVKIFSGKINPYAGELFLSLGCTELLGQTAAEADNQFGHDATTLPGYSGAPVLDPQTCAVIGLHVLGDGDGLEHSPAVHGEGPRDLGRRTNGAIMASALLRKDWMADILRGVSNAPPSGIKSIHWRGGALPRRAARGQRPESTLLTRTVAYRRTDIPVADKGVAPDRADSRDRIFQPGLSQAPEELLPDPGLIGDQGIEGSCASFAVAAAIEQQLGQRDGYKPARRFTASVRMLDRMARRHDEWLDDLGDGTSLRAVIKGFYHNGVCTEKKCPYVPRQPQFFLTRDIAKEARKITLGTYLRVALSVDDMRMAVMEAKAVVVTARIHSGWRRPDAKGCIAYDIDKAAGDDFHAFVVTGYDEDGFIVKNARGAKWGGYKGLRGHALWSYDDWADNCLDAWVIRLAPPGDKAFAVSAATEGQLSTPRRLGLLGHVVHAERFGLVEDGTLGLGAQGAAETGAYLDSGDARQKYKRLMLFFHEPLMDGDLIARLALRLNARLKPREIYPFHVVYGLDEMLACRLRLSHDVGRAVELFLREGTSRDQVLQRQLGPVIRTQVDHFIQGARDAAQTLLRDALSVLLFAAPERRIDVVSFGLGAVPGQAVVEAYDPRRLPHLAIACPVKAGDAQIWPLADQRDETDLPGWLGSWGDIVAGAYRRTIRETGGAEAATVQDLMARPGFVADLLNKLGR